MDKLHTAEQIRLKLLSLLQLAKSLNKEIDNVILHNTNQNANDLFMLKHKADGLKALAEEVERSLFKR